MTIKHKNVDGTKLDLYQPFPELISPIRDSPNMPTCTIRLVNLAAEYQEQFSWRPWSRIFGEVPLQAGQVVLDLGCGVGDQSRELAFRGCKVIGLDGNQELINAAVLKHLPNCEFRTSDLRRPANLDTKVDGIWCSFVAAYFTNLTEFLSAWALFLRDGGWIAITEIEDLFGHEPLSQRTRGFFQLLSKRLWLLVDTTFIWEAG